MIILENHKNFIVSKGVIIFIILISLYVGFYYFHPYNNVRIETIVMTPDVSSYQSKASDEDNVYLLSYSNVLYFDEINNNVIHESFIALDETRFSYSISERDIIEAKAFRYYRAIGISKIQTDDLIEHYNSHLKKIDIQIPKGKLRFGYLMES